MRGLTLFEAVGEIDSKFILAAHDVLETKENVIRLHSHKKLWRTLLIAAALSALFVGTAFAAGLFGLSARLISAEQTDEGGKMRHYVSTNGVAGSDEARATAEWIEFESQYEAEHGVGWQDYEISFAQGDYELINICRLYSAYDKVMADKLLEIAEKYSLALYTDQLTLTDPETFYAVSGAEDYFATAEHDFSYGYVFADGSFKTEGFVEIGGRPGLYVLHRGYAGSLYPYRSGTVGGFEEWEYTTAQGYDVGLVSYDKMGRSSFAVYYNDSVSGVYVDLDFELSRNASDTAEDLRQAAQEVADALDLSAVCASQGMAGEILGRDRNPAHNQVALAALECFEDSPVFRAGAEFQDFFTATFYGESFTGTYGLEGYADIDAELTRLSEKYGLAYAEHKSVGNGYAADAVTYDNGAWFVSGREPEEYQLHYIPKNALYTRLSDYTAFSEYDKVWQYETASGETVICVCGLSRPIMPMAFYETEEAYVLLTMPLYGGDVGVLERAADAVDFAGIKEAMR